MIRENVSLRNLNTFGIDVRTRYLVEINSLEALYSLVSLKETPDLQQALVLGGGSNILFTRHYEGLIIKMNIQGIDILHETADYTDIKAYAGQDWDHLVSFCVDKGLGGIENLSLIPGTVGASPIQNIGAYGVELRDVLRDVMALDRKSGLVVTVPVHACGFGYRTSIFKTTDMDRYIILSVTLRLVKHPAFYTQYGTIGEELKRMNVQHLTLQSIREAVIRIRQSKLPDPCQLGNAGSFFKNPSVSSEAFHSLVTSFPGIIGYSQPDGTYKLAAGWMIEQCGWKGYRRGDAGVHEKQALVLVNYGHASGSEMLDLSEEIRHSVSEKFGVMLENEVNIR